MSQLSFTANSCILPQNSYILSKTLPVIYASHLTLKLTQPNSFSNPEHEKPLSTTLPKVIHISRWLSEDGQLFTETWLHKYFLFVCSTLYQVVTFQLRQHSHLKSVHDVILLSCSFNSLG